MIKLVSKMRMFNGALMATNFMLLVILVAVKATAVYTVFTKDIILFTSTLIISVLLQAGSYYMLQTLKNKKSSDKFNKLIDISNYFAQNKIYKENA